MQYKIKQKNHIKCKSRNSDYNNYYIIKNIKNVLGAKNPIDLHILMKLIHKIKQ